MTYTLRQANHRILCTTEEEMIAISGITDADHAYLLVI